MGLKVIEDKPWYHGGLPFKCTECGQCCTGAPGYTWVTENEMLRIADFLKISLDQFAKSYVRRVGERYALLENPQNFDCVFLKNKKCEIYPVRPVQCRTFPWWPSNLASKEAWDEAAKCCEGINSEAPITPYAKIQEQLETNS